ncbi:MAG: hypothetical protein M0C28_35250 [Candidatus Moduliflexus flocculans]|nr:hypothetical protein [Candidatus Moduliflexus flocculans]
MAHNGDPVIDSERRTVIGCVTSCAIDAEGFMTGQAYVDLAYAKEGTPIGIHQGGNMDRPAGDGEGGEQVREVVGAVE